MSSFTKRKLSNFTNTNNQIIKLDLVVLGSGAVGKTALTVQFQSNYFIHEYDPTIEDSFTKNCKIDNFSYSLNILDSAGNEDYTAIRDQYLKNSDGFLIVYDISDRVSFEKTSELVDQIKMVKDVESFPMVLIGNKCDLDSEGQRKVSIIEGSDLSKFYGSPFFETSAKTTVNVESSFFQLVREIQHFEQLEKERQLEKEKKLLKNYNNNNNISNNRTNSFNSIGRKNRVKFDLGDNNNNNNNNYNNENENMENNNNKNNINKSEIYKSKNKMKNNKNDKISEIECNKQRNLPKKSLKDKIINSFSCISRSNN
ncbi:hypothetical protein ACTA71_009217 [Dictyostelium dimigraforme]